VKIQPRSVPIIQKHQFAIARKRGFTLLEIMLVVGILIAVSAIALPSVTRSFSVQSLQKAADRVRVAMGQARVRAIRTGDIHAVGYLPNSGWIDVASLDQISTITSEANRRIEQQQQGITSDYDDDLLPGRVVFVGGQSVSDGRSNDAMTQTANVNQLTTILFYPDGTSQDAQLTLQNEIGQLMDVNLRGLTGIASVSRRNEVRQ
jgi:prepilin-type N-terminal cleavage/methylation domain-containing protein